MALEKYLEKMSRYSEIFVIDRSNTDIYDQNELLLVSLFIAINQIFLTCSLCIYICFVILQIMEKLTEIDCEGERLIRDDYKFLEWRNGCFNERAASYHREKSVRNTSQFFYQLHCFYIPILRHFLDSPLRASSSCPNSRSSICRWI